MRKSKLSKFPLIGVYAIGLGSCGPAADMNAADMNSAAPGKAAASEPAPDRTMIASLRAASAWANRDLTRAEIETYTRTPHVLESLRVERREVALLRPDAPPAPGRQAAAAPRPRSGSRSIPEPAEPLGAVLASSQTVYATLMPAQCEGLIELPDPARAIPPIRRRWHSEVRIAAPADAVLRDEFRRALADPRLRQAVRGLAIRLVDRDPNVVVRGLNEAERCYDTDPQNGVCGEPFVGRCGGARFRKYDRLAAEITAGRRSYLRDASDFAGTDAGSPVFGFTLSDGEGRIDGALCLLPDSATGGPAAHGPEFSREAKAAFAIDCIAHVLGLGGPPGSIGAQRQRAQRMFVTVDDSGAVRWSRTALALLASSYS